MKEYLNEEELLLLNTVREEYIDAFIRNPTRPLGGEKLVKFLYSLIEKGEKEREIKIIRFESPMASQLFANAMNNLRQWVGDMGGRTLDRVRDQVWAQVWAQVQDQVGAQVGDQVRDQIGTQVGDQVRDQVGAQVRAQVRAQVWAQVWAQVRDQVWAQVGAQVWAQVRDQVWAQVGAQVGTQVGDQVRDQVRDQVLESTENKEKNKYFNSYSIVTEVGWVSFHEYFSRIGIINNKKLVKFCQLVKESGVWDILCFENLAIISSIPTTVRRDDAKNLHSDQKPAIEWSDGYCLYYLSGVNFDYGLWKKICDRDLDLEDVSRIENADQRAVAISMLKPDLLLDHAKAEIIHEGIKGTKLYRVENFMGRGTTEYCMLMECPSTGRDFLEWVEPSVGAIGDADIAQASSFVDDSGQTLSLEDYLVAQEA